MNDFALSWNPTHEEDEMAWIIGGTIKASFAHVYERKNEEWAEKTLQGLNKVMNFWFIYHNPYKSKPGDQRSDGPFTMEDLNPDSKSPFLNDDWPEAWCKFQNRKQPEHARVQKDDSSDDEGVNEVLDRWRQVNACSDLVKEVKNIEVNSAGSQATDKNANKEPLDLIFKTEIRALFPKAYGRTTAMLGLGISIRRNFAFLQENQLNPLTWKVMKALTKVYNFEQTFIRKREEDGPFVWNMRDFLPLSCLSESDFNSSESTDAVDKEEEEEVDIEDRKNEGKKRKANSPKNDNNGREESK